MNSWNEVRRSVARQGQATRPHHTAASGRMQGPTPLGVVRLRPQRAAERAGPTACRGNPTNLGDVQRRDGTADAPKRRGRDEEHNTASEHNTDEHGAKHERSIYERQPRGQNQRAGRRSSMKARTTQLRGSSREAHATERTSASNQAAKAKRRPRTGQAGTARTDHDDHHDDRFALAGAAGPATADDPDQQLDAGRSSASVRHATASSKNFDFAQSFTTGANVTGYELESICLDFADFQQREPRDTVYVLPPTAITVVDVPDHSNGAQIAVLTKNGVNYAGLQRPG